jgi:hypothetical protein
LGLAVDWLVEARDCAGGASGPAEACAFKRSGPAKTTIKIPQKAVIAVLLVFKIASTSALPKAQQV